MRKILSLITALCLCICAVSSLTACGGGENGDGEVKTTVSSLEWAAAFALKNVTATGFLTEGGDVEPVLFKIADTVYYSENDGYRAWCVNRGNGYYLYSDDDTEGMYIGSFSISVSAILMSFHIAKYEDFTYDEATKSYFSIDEARPDSYYRYDLYFENGRIVKFESRNEADTVTYSFTFTGYGSTVVELPDFIE